MYTRIVVVALQSKSCKIITPFKEIRPIHINNPPENNIHPSKPSGLYVINDAAIKVMDNTTKNKIIIFNESLSFLIKNL